MDFMEDGGHNSACNNKAEGYCRILRKRTGPLLRSHGKIELDGFGIYFGAKSTRLNDQR